MRTAPLRTILEPKQPALSESLLCFGSFLDPLLLMEHADTIRSISQATAKNYAQAIDCLSAAKSFLSDSRQIALSCLQSEKLAAYARHFSCKHFPRKSRRGREEVRFLTSINAKGITSLAATSRRLCPDVYFICDREGAASSLFLSALRSHALENGHDVISCMCPLAPHSRIDHLLIPDCGLALLTENPFHDFSSLVPDRRIHAKRFLEVEGMRSFKKRLAFNQKAAAQMIEQAVGSLQDNKRLHDRLEKIYLSAMDFSMMDVVLGGRCRTDCRAKSCPGSHPFINDSAQIKTDETTRHDGACGFVCFLFQKFLEEESIFCAYLHQFGSSSRSFTTCLVS